MPAGVLGDILEVARPGQRLEHLDRRDDVVVDDLALFLRQRSGPDREVPELVFGQEARRVAGNIGPAVFGDPPHALHVAFPHCLATDVAGPQE